MIISPDHHLDATLHWSPPQQDTVCSHNTKKALPDDKDVTKSSKCGPALKIPQIQI